MATIAATNISSDGAVTVTETTLDGSDDFIYNPERSPVLVLRNGSGGALTVTIDGADSTTIKAEGAPAFDISGGYSTGSIADGTTVAINLSTVRAYLAGTISVSGGTGIVAQLLERG